MSMAFKFFTPDSNQWCGQALNERYFCWWCLKREAVNSLKSSPDSTKESGQCTAVWEERIGFSRWMRYILPQARLLRACEMQRSPSAGRLACFLSVCLLSIADVHHWVKAKPSSAYSKRVAIPPSVSASIFPGELCRSLTLSHALGLKKTLLSNKCRKCSLLYSSSRYSPCSFMKVLSTPVIPSP